MTQYALTVMTIHFLQQVEPPVLRNLQDNTNHSSYDGSPDEERVYIYGWNCFFDKRRSTDTKSENCSDQGKAISDAGLFVHDY